MSKPVCSSTGGPGVSPGQALAPYIWRHHLRSPVRTTCLLRLPHRTAPRQRSSGSTLWIKSGGCETAQEVRVRRGCKGDRNHEQSHCQARCVCAHPRRPYLLPCLQVTVLCAIGVVAPRVAQGLLPQTRGRAVVSDTRRAAASPPRPSRLSVSNVCVWRGPSPARPW